MKFIIEVEKEKIWWFIENYFESQDDPKAPYEMGLLDYLAQEGEVKSVIVVDEVS